jgi:tRNA1(Val) A37 N6-methylase TrmN6
MDLQQFYTQHRYSEHLVNNLAIDSPKNAFDLGFGEGDLLLATKRRWATINLIGADIDEKNISVAHLNKQIDAFELDGFRPDLPDIISKKYGEIDLLVSNPPYFTCDLNLNISSVLTEAGLSRCVSQTSKKIPAELVFLAQNLRLLTKRGELGIILPAGLISGERWREVRELLFSEYNVEKVIQLPTSSFTKTDAQTFILIITRKKGTGSTILSHVDYDEEFTINYSQASDRADYTFYSQQKNRYLDYQLSDSDFSVFRGSLTHDQLKVSTEHYIHTSHLKNTATEIIMPFAPSKKGRNACPGDIMIGRVGRRCLGRVAIIKSGSIPISDCVIVVRAKSCRVRGYIWEKLKAEKAMKIFYDMSLGVGAKYLTHKIVNEYIQFGK